MPPFTLLIKPSGSDCNVDCGYCFYKCRAPEIGRGRQRMTYDVLERLIKDYLGLRFPMSGFAWQGGEPTLMGLDFFKRAIELQKQYGAPGQHVTNALQTNAILLNDDWCRLLHETNFLAGISIDGPKEYHDHYRKDYSGAGTFDKVMRAIDNCKEQGVEFNTLTLLNNVNGSRPDELFDFFVGNKIHYLQFIPCVETDPSTAQIAPFSITPQQYGKFLCRLFDRWLDYGPQNISIRDFESILSYCAMGRHTICTFDKQCNAYVVVEHTGDVFCCDFFVEPKWRVGNIFETPIEKLAASPRKKEFARVKRNLCTQCLVCRHLAACRGGCMKDRVPFDKENYGTQSYFCEGYKMFFDYSMPRFMRLAAQIRSGTLNLPKGPKA